MSWEREYLRNAKEAERNAARAKTDHQREAYEKVARGWRDLIAAGSAKGCLGDRPEVIAAFAHGRARAGQGEG